eukprot:COSAG02_NODE_142_length_34188_cov_183.180791_18_plen_220_part_00
MCSYVVPGTGPSCVLSRHVLSDGSRWPVSDGVTQALSSAGVARVIVGHTPIGNCPSVIRSNPLATDFDGKGGLTVFMCDTSYSNLAKIAGGGQRGKAVSELVVLSDAQTAVHGELETGDSISYVIDGPCGGDSHVGRDLTSHQQILHATKEAESSGTVYVAARLAKASSSKAYVVQRTSASFKTEQWLVGSDVVNDGDDVHEAAQGREQHPHAKKRHRV